MSFLAIIRGNLLADVTMHRKNNKDFGRIVVADNDQKNADNEKIIFSITCFDYSMSKKRAETLKSGTHVLIRGAYSDKLVENTKKREMQIERTVYVENLEVLAFPKKDE